MSDTNPILTSVESLQIEDSTGAIINPATKETLIARTPQTA